jgi:hypothetical protein
LDLINPLVVLAASLRGGKKQFLKKRKEKKNSKLALTADETDSSPVCP